MDRYEFDIKIEQIKKMMKKKDFAAAVKLADTIEWRKVKENQLLIMAADVYEIAGQYDSAREALLLAYEKTGLGRQLAYRLCRLSVKRGDFTEAQEFYEEFTENSPRDAGRYILQYEMAKGKGEPIEKRIEILETFIEADMDDRWAYELAKLYHRAHMREKCVELCDTIILWFADGKYVEKALELKQLYVPLSENQRLKYEAQKSRKATVAMPTESKDVVAEFAGDTMEIPSKLEGNQETVAQESAQPEPEEESSGAEENASEVSDEYEEYKNGDVLDKVHEEDIDVNSIHVKDFSVNNKYDTMNIQKELAKSMSTMFDKTMEIFKPVAPRSQDAEEEEAQDDQIEGQMSLEEVLAMFESGELQTRDESEKPGAKDESEELQTRDESEGKQEEQSPAKAEPKKEPNLMETMEIIIGKTDESFQSLEDFFPEDEDSEVSQLAEIVAEDIQEDIDEDIDKEIQEEMEDIEAAKEDYSEEAESEGQETESVMYNLNDDPQSSEEGVPEWEDDFDDDEDEELLQKQFTEVEDAEDIIEDMLEDIGEDIEEADIASEVEDVSDEEVTEDTAEEDAKVIEKAQETAEEVKETHEKESEVEMKEAKPVKKGEKQSDIAKRELKNFISKFSGVQGLDKQILKVMQSVLKTDTEPVKFIFVKGEVKSGKTTLAVEVIKLANKIIQRRDQKIAKIKGISLNDKSVEALMKVLDGSDVLIERVSDVQPELFVEFIDKLKEEGKPRVVIFEDEKSLADDFLSNVPEGYGDFANVIDIKVNKIRDWAKIAEEYAKSQGYVIDEMGTLALSAKIDQLRAITLVVHKNHVEQLIDGAIAKANKFSLRNLFGKKKTEEGYGILTEKNFMD